MLSNFLELWIANISRLKDLQKIKANPGAHFLRTRKMLSGPEAMLGFRFQRAEEHRARIIELAVEEGRWG